LVDGIARELYFASGAFAEKSNKDKGNLTLAQMYRFWQEAAPLFTMLVEELHPHTAYQIVQTLYHLFPCAPREVFLLATQSIRSSSAAGFQYESLAVGEAVNSSCGRSPTIETSSKASVGKSLYVLLHYCRCWTYSSKPAGPKHANSPIGLRKSIAEMGGEFKDRLCNKEKKISITGFVPIENWESCPIVSRDLRLACN
jgi:hypothetical protein